MSEGCLTAAELGAFTPHAVAVSTHALRLGSLRNTEQRLPGLHNTTKFMVTYLSPDSFERPGGGEDHALAHQPLRPWPAASVYGFLTSEKSKPWLDFDSESHALPYRAICAEEYLKLKPAGFTYLSAGRVFWGHEASSLRDFRLGVKLHKRRTVRVGQVGP